MDLAWSEWAKIRGGLSYATASVDRPYGWIRADIHPLGPVPSRRDEPVSGTRVSVGGSVLQRDSESLGWMRFTTGDVELRSGPFLLSGAWVQTNQDGDITGSWIAEIGAGLPKPLGAACTPICDTKQPQGWNPMKNFGTSAPHGCLGRPLIFSLPAIWRLRFLERKERWPVKMLWIWAAESNGPMTP